MLQATATSDVVSYMNSLFYVIYTFCPQVSFSIQVLQGTDLLFNNQALHLVATFSGLDKAMLLKGLYCP